jgi:Fic family protein
MGHWVKFFLNALHTTALKGQETFKNILALRNRTEAAVLSLGAKAKRASVLVNHLYKKPIVSVNDAATLLEVTHQTANALIKDFEQLGILAEQTGYKRNRMFLFRDYYNLFLS